MTDDPLDKIKAKVEARFKAFDRKREKLSKLFMQAQTPEERLLRLADLVRQHAEYWDWGLDKGHWRNRELRAYAGLIESIALDLKGVNE